MPIFSLLHDTRRMLAFKMPKSGIQADKSGVYNTKMLPFFPVLLSSHHYPSMMGALLCITVSTLSCPVALITVSPLLVKSYS